MPDLKNTTVCPLQYANNIQDYIELKKLINNQISEAKQTPQESTNRLVT